MQRLYKKNNKQVTKLLKLLNANKSVFSILILLGLLADIFLIDGSSDVRIFGILFLSIIGIVFYKISSRVIFSLCLFLLVVMFLLFLFTQTSEMTEKTAVWFVLFFAVGIVRQWKE